MFETRISVLGKFVGEHTHIRRPGILSGRALSRHLAVLSYDDH